jgi:tetratricopeptide (TPR) repeat protein
MLPTTLLLILLQAGTQSAYDKALALMQRREYQAAAAEFHRAIEAETPASPKYGQISLQLGQAYFLSGRSAQAIPWLEKAVESGAGTTETFYMLGNAGIQVRNIDGARGAFARLFRVKPDSAAAHLITAQMLIRQDADELAVKELRRAIELDGRIPEAHYLLGILATYKSDSATAIAELTEEIAVNPNFAMAYYKLGDAYTRREEWDRAIPLLQKSVWLNPDYSGPYILLGKAYWKRDALGKGCCGAPSRSIRKTSQRITCWVRFS